MYVCVYTSCTQELDSEKTPRQKKMEEDFEELNTIASNDDLFECPEEMNKSGT